MLQAPETDSDTASVSSAPTDSARSTHLPSMEEMVAGCSLEDPPSGSATEEDEDEFFDAPEGVSPLLWASDLPGLMLSSSPLLPLKIMPS